jgi:hypothetical protein
MTLYKVIGKIDSNNEIYHQVLPYSLFGTIHTYFSKNISYTMGGGYGFITRLKEFISFLERCYLNETRAKKMAIHLDKCHDIEW